MLLETLNRILETCHHRFSAQVTDESCHGRFTIAVYLCGTCTISTSHPHVEHPKYVPVLVLFVCCNPDQPHHIFCPVIFRISLRCACLRAKRFGVAALKAPAGSEASVKLAHRSLLTPSVENVVSCSGHFALLHC